MVRLPGLEPALRSRCVILGSSLNLLEPNFFIFKLANTVLHRVVCAKDLVRLPPKTPIKYYQLKLLSSLFLCLDSPKTIQLIAKLSSEAKPLDNCFFWAKISLQSSSLHSNFVILKTWNTIPCSLSCAQTAQMHADLWACSEFRSIVCRHARDRACVTLSCVFPFAQYCLQQTAMPSQEARICAFLTAILTFLFNSFIACILAVFCLTKILL